MKLKHILYATTSSQQITLKTSTEIIGPTLCLDLLLRQTKYNDLKVISIIALSQNHLKVEVI